MMWFDALVIHPSPEPLESFTGYLVRLAELNVIRSKSALSAVAFPHLKRKANWTDLPRVSYGALPDVANCIDSQLHATTFYYLLNKFQRSVHPAPARIFLADAIAPHLRYCPLCLQESGYYKLSWRFTHLTGCPQHNVYLLDHCGYCHTPIPLVPSPLRIGICPNCDGDLRNCQTQSVHLEEQSVLQRVSHDLTFLLLPQPWEDASKPIQSFGPTLSQMRRNQGWNQKALAQHLNVSKDVLQAIEGRKSVGRGETFQHYLDYLAIFSLSFCDGFAQAQTSKTDIQAQWLERIQWAVARLEADEKKLTQQSICRLLRCSPSTLKPYPAVQTFLRELGIRQRQHKEKPSSQPKRSVQFDQREETYLAQVKEIVQQMKAEGIPYSRREVAQRMGMTGPGLCRYPRIASFLADCLATARAERQVDWLERVEKATSQLQRQEQAVTQKAVARLLGISAERLRHHTGLRTYLATFEDYNTALHIQQQQERETALYEAVTSMIQQMRLGGQHMTQMAVAQALNTSVQRLKSYESIRPVMEEITNHAKHETADFFRS